MDNEIKTESRFAKPRKRDFLRAYASFRKNERRIFWALVALAIIATLFSVRNANRLFMAEVPTEGGSFTEGIMGTPRFVNPVLALSDADRDLSALVYSGLLRKTADGGYIPDLAEKYEILEDGLTYIFTLRDNIFFQDGTPVTIDDIIFTIQKAKDPTIKSPKRPNWEGVAIQKINDKTVSFTLKQPYAEFLDNTTLGILPKNEWKDISSEEFSYSEFNIKGLGSGPYIVDSVSKNRAGIPVSYTLKAFKKFALGHPYIDTIKLNFYGNADDLLNALQSGDIDNASALMPEEAKALEARGVQIKRYPLPRAYGVFFNQSSAPVLSDLPVRQALDMSVNRMAVVNSVLYGYGTPLFGPIPSSNQMSLAGQNGAENGIGRIDEAKALLEKNGWKMSTSTGIMTKKTKKETSVLSFSLSTADKPELKATAEILKSAWEKIGVSVEIKIFEPGDFSQNVIRPRKYDAILFGEVIGENDDPYPFWHSSQRNDPGLNIALYANQKTDKIMETARETEDATSRAKQYALFEDAIRADVPAVFVYSPEFIYVLSPDLRGMEIGQLTVPAERFLSVYKWYSDTDWVWKIFN